MSLGGDIPSIYVPRGSLSSGLTRPEAESILALIGCREVHRSRVYHPQETSNSFMSRCQFSAGKSDHDVSDFAENNINSSFYDLLMSLIDCNDAGVTDRWLRLTSAGWLNERIIVTL